MDAIQAIKDSIKIAKDIGNVELRGQLLDVQSELNGLKEKVNDLTTANRDLREKLSQKESLTFDQNKGAYFLTLPDNSSSGPYCSRCFDVSGSLVRMHFNDLWFVCPECKTNSRAE